MRILTYYTESYKEQVLRLIRSAEVYRYKVKAIKIDEQRSWGYKVLIKPQLILDEYQKFGGNFLYLDADTELLQSLDKLCTKDHHILVRERNLEDKYNLGVIYFGEDQSIKQFLENWVELTKQKFSNTKSVDQQPFVEAIQLYPDVKVGQLPYQYNFLPADLAQHDKSEAIIYHYKASRENSDYKKWLDEIGHYYGPDIITKNTGLPTYNVVLKPKETNLTDLYEDGNIIIIPNKRFEGIDYKLIREVEVKQLNHIPIKKNKSHWLMAPIRTLEKHPLYNFFPKSKKDALHFQNQIKLFNKHIKQAAIKYFPHYAILEDNQWTWRFTLTENEDMHVDSYERGNHNNHMLRIFYNLDNEPRIWRISLGVQSLIQNLLNQQDKIQQDEQINLQKLHPNELNAIINKNTAWQDLPYLELAIQPYSLMFVETRIQSHQIIWGRKLAAYSYLIDPKSMNNPKKNFVNLVKQTLAANHTPEESQLSESHN